MRSLSAIGVVVLAWGVWSASAEAFVVNGTSSADAILVGMINQDGTGQKAWVCVDNGSSGSWTQVGDTSGLTSGGQVNGGAGNDVMAVVSSKGLSSVPTHCQVSGQSWHELLYGAYYVDLYGEGDNDTLSDGGGAHNTFLLGGDGNDALQQVSTIGYLAGENGNDNLYGWAIGGYDVLNGNAGTDCLWSYDSYSTASCGPETGEKAHLTPMPADCETPVSSCP